MSNNNTVSCLVHNLIQINSFISKVAPCSYHWHCCAVWCCAPSVHEQGIDGFVCKPTLVHDTDYMVEKTYHIAPYLGASGTWVMHQWTLVWNVFSFTKTIVGAWRSTHVIFHLVKKPLGLVKNNPERLYAWENIPFSMIYRPLLGPL